MLVMSYECVFVGKVPLQLGNVSLLLSVILYFSIIYIYTLMYVYVDRNMVCKRCCKKEAKMNMIKSEKRYSYVSLLFTVLCCVTRLGSQLFIQR